MGRTTLRIGLHHDAWQGIPRRILARGRQVRVGWFRHTDPRVITLVLASRRADRPADHPARHRPPTPPRPRSSSPPGTSPA
ncbi:DUF5994 family protein [Nonomuraea ferruginea]